MQNKIRTILGIDPGIATTGYGAVQYDNQKFRYLACGVIETAKGQPVEERLLSVYESVGKLIDTFRPEALAIEELFYHNNQKTVINVAQSRGVILLAARTKGIPIYEYTPLQVKRAVVGYGRAEKRQVQEMVRILFSLPGIPRPDDAADALAIAACHGYSAASKLASLDLLADSKKTGGK